MRGRSCRMCDLLGFLLSNHPDGLDNHRFLLVGVPADRRRASDAFFAPSCAQYRFILFFSLGVVWKPDLDPSRAIARSGALGAGAIEYRYEQ